MQQSAFKVQQNQQFDIRKNQYQHHWKTDLPQAICSDPCFCFISIFCPPCVSYVIRRRVLYNDMTRYTCCNNDCPCSGRLSEQSCPELCLGLEACCCFAQSVASSRWAIQDEQQIQNTQCDNCIIGTMIAAQYLACICNLAACISGSQELGAIADIVDTVAHILWCSVCACMQTQAKVQLDERDKNPSVVRANFNPLQAPVQQAIPPPGQGGYPQHPPSGQYPGQQQGGYPQQLNYPPQGYPQQPQQGYPTGYPQGPPQNYPPQGYPPAQQMGR